MSGSTAPANAPHQASRVVQVSEEHLEPLAEIIRLAWDPRATAEGVGRARQAAAAVNPHGEGVEVPTFLFLSGDRPLGHMTTIPVHLSVRGQRHPAHWFKGFWVVPEHRNGPVGFLLLKEALRHLGTTLSTVVQPPPRRLFKSLGLSDFGQLPNFVRILRPARVLQRLDLGANGLSIGPEWVRKGVAVAQLPGLAHLCGAAVGAGLKGLTLLQPSARQVSAVAPQTIDPVEADALWARVSAGLAAAPLRDFAHIRARYISKGDTYTALLCRSGEGLDGFAMLRRPRESGDGRLRGIRMAALSDLLYPPDRPEIGLRLLAAAERTAHDLGADALLCSPSHGSVPPLLRRRGYVRLGGNVHFMARPDGYSLDGLDLAHWWLMRADGEADDAL